LNAPQLANAFSREAGSCMGAIRPFSGSGRNFAKPPIPAISLVMLLVDSVELLQVRPHHFNLALD
jgi:hypothetical protein